MAPPRAFLDVEASATGRRWVGLDPEQVRLSEAMCQTTGLPDAVARVLVRRGVLPEAAAGFLTPALRDLMPDPRSLRDMEKAAARLLDALRERQRIAIFADYDVDGGASAALLLDWLRQMGHGATLYIPDRIDEGYGPNVPAMEQLADAHDLIVCVDCGTLSHEPIAAAMRRARCEVVVLDHHLGGETLPPAHAVVNPNRQDEDGTLAHLCAAGVVFLLLVEVNRRLREAGTKGPDLLSMLDLVALATVADVAPLVGLNRALVRQGLKVAAQRRRPGMVALADVARMDGPPSSYHLGFLLGPRVNAGGRIGAADLGARLLSTTDPAEARAIADKLDELNAERREIEARVTDAALAQAEERGLDGPLVWAAGEGWHPGVVGIVASRLKEATNRPAVVIGFDGDEGKGSGRSISGVDLGASIQRLAAEGLLTKGGGHKMAAGLSLARDRLEPAMERLAELLARQGAGDAGPADLALDAALMPRAATVEMIEQIEAAGPFGAGAPAPRFVFPDQAIRFAKQVGENHLKVTFGSTDTGTLEAICFGGWSGPMGPLLTNAGHRRFHVAGRLEVNNWGGRQRPQLRLEDVAEVK
ncbi:single-stranded-DNA-specific exonuclease RecJ [Brevirhabdus pacifica]|uniref:Single-stranded-DNA-specific exonuclease RecJ n=2 Tax=Brevirhabdus pacifica TaxID=1267768 RepID=A0A1U7DG65_9RHOB|nr:single-stranded-DNA-specific exonuclease RecJ [Brevirhabdus pacifica]APX88889.1 single-stranded-DNA-specific exonuclease RecJ [Brevirhabdus pacifica]OWU80121.1 recombinase RecJ [Loktanella sp. 22II-4b]PJJ86567.1 exonuclease RecJ [Brevirhabdus pacifica]